MWGSLRRAPINSWNEAACTCSSSFVQVPKAKYVEIQVTLTQPNAKEGNSAGERTTGSTEDGKRLWRTSAKGQERVVRHGSGEAIITKKRFVPETFLPCACSYEGRLNSRRVWVRVWAMSYLRARAACSFTRVTLKSNY